MDLLADRSSVYLQAQIDAGAQVLQLFDSWVGCLVARTTTSASCCRTSRRCSTRLCGHGVPVIHFANGAATLLPLMAQAGGDVVGVDWRVDLDEAWRRLDEAADCPGGGFAIQGNLDPIALLGPRAEVEARAADVLRRAAGRAGPHLQPRTRADPGRSRPTPSSGWSTSCTAGTCRRPATDAGAGDPRRARERNVIRRWRPST